MKQRDTDSYEQIQEGIEETQSYNQWCFSSVLHIDNSCPNGGNKTFLFQTDALAYFTARSDLINFVVIWHGAATKLQKYT